MLHFCYAVFGVSQNRRSVQQHEFVYLSSEPINTNPAVVRTVYVESKLCTFGWNFLNVLGPNP
jgi:hypothetical protein